MLAIYCRISKEKEEGKDRSINDQKLLGIELAKKINSSYKLYIDEGVSGTNDIKDRPAFAEMLEDVANNKIAGVYAYDQSRLERSPEVRFVFKKLLKENGVMLYTDNGEVNLNDDEGEMLGDIVSIMNQYYVRITQKKIKSVLKRNALDGKAHGILAYGYGKDDNGYLIIDEEESKIVKRIYDLSLNGVGTRSIAETLTSEKIPTRYNKIGRGTITTTDKYSGKITVTDKKNIIWADKTVYGIIKNTIYKGERLFGGITYKCPAIIEPYSWQKVNDNLKANRNGGGKKVEHKYLLKGLLICGKCGRNLYGRSRVSKKDNYYMCSSKRYKHENCGNRSINIDVLETFVWERFFKDKILKTLVKEHYEKHDNQEYIVNLESELQTIEDKLNQLSKDRKRAIKLAVKGLLSEDDVQPEINKIDHDKSDFEIKKTNILIQLEGYRKGNHKIKDIAKDLEAIKDKIGFNDKRELVTKYINSIKIRFAEFPTDAIDDVYFLSIKFMIPDLSVEDYSIDRNYNYAIERMTNIFIPLSKKLKLEAKEKPDWYMKNKYRHLLYERYKV